MGPANKKKAPDNPSLDNATFGEDKNKQEDNHATEEVDDKLIGDDLIFEQATKGEADADNELGDKENNY